MAIAVSHPHHCIAALGDQQGHNFNPPECGCRQPGLTHHRAHQQPWHCTQSCAVGLASLHREPLLQHGSAGSPTAPFHPCAATKAPQNQGSHSSASPKDPKETPHVQIESVWVREEMKVK